MRHSDRLGMRDTRSGKNKPLGVLLELLLYSLTLASQFLLLELVAHNFVFLSASVKCQAFFHFVGKKRRENIVATRCKSFRNRTLPLAVIHMKQCVQCTYNTVFFSSKVRGISLNVLQITREKNDCDTKWKTNVICHCHHYDNYRAGCLPLIAANKFERHHQSALYEQFN